MGGTWEVLSHCRRAGEAYVFSPRAGGEMSDSGKAIVRMGGAPDPDV
jgi:hypothetical protein